MPGNTGPGCCSFPIRFSRSSSFTLRARKRCSEKELWRSSPRVRGRLMIGTPNKTNFASDYTLLRHRHWEAAALRKARRDGAPAAKGALHERELSERGRCRPPFAEPARHGGDSGGSSRNTGPGCEHALLPSGRRAVAV